MSVKINMASGLKNARKAAGKSVDEVGAIVSKSGKTISAWEVGRGQPDGDELILICQYLGCHISDFYGEEYSSCIYDDNANYNHLSKDEQRLIDIYRKLEGASKDLIIAIADGILMGQENGTTIKNFKVETDED